jgi:biotin synthase
MSQIKNQSAILETLQGWYALPLLDLVYKAATVHRENFATDDIQRCVLLSIKTGGCPEDCGYCSQSSHNAADIDRTPLLTVEEVREKAEAAKAIGATRFCMGAAWRNPKDGESFDRVLEMVKTVRGLEMEACVTLGMLTPSQAKRLKEAGLTAYNHNLDTSREHYSEVIQTRTYDDRLDTVRTVAEAGISVCCGGILGMGESEADRLKLIAELSMMPIPPESIPINLLVPIQGTPLENAAPVDPFQVIRLIAVTRLAFPKARVRLSAGRDKMEPTYQTLCFLAGANSIFYGDKLLTAPNPTSTDDASLLESLGLPVPEGARKPAYDGRKMKLPLSV